jgi:hypothetical protein
MHPANVTALPLSSVTRRAVVIIAADVRARKSEIGAVGVLTAHLLFASVDTVNIDPTRRRPQ